MVERIRREWKAAGREGEPRISALQYFGLGDEQASRAALLKYYAFIGEYAQGIADAAVRTSSSAKEAIRAYEEVGVTELMFIPTVAEVDEVDRLADLVLA